MPLSELTRMTAVEAVRRLKAREIQPADLIDAAMARMDEVEPAVNALPTRCPERARAAAAALPRHAGDPDAPGWLAGLPVAIKDLLNVAGVRSTQGSPIFADHIPERSDLVVETLEQRGGIVLAKSNTPEFGAGANTFNPVFGKTRNPWNTSLTCGGSSGGSAVALATGEVWLASGSDLGGSLRIPASFCGIVGMRPSPGRVARGPNYNIPDDLAIEGPMARNVADVALMLDAMAGPAAEDPTTLPLPALPFQDAVRNPTRPVRVAFSPNLGFLPVHPEVAEVAERAARRFEAMGIPVDRATPDFSDAQEIFQTLRALFFVTDKAELLRTKRDQLKPDVIWNIEKGMKLDADAIGRAVRARSALLARVGRFFQTYDVLLTPAVIVPPFDVDTVSVRKVGDVEFDNYIDWLSITYALSMTRCASLSLPAGFLADGRPVGLQMVTRANGEAPLLSAAWLLEEALGLRDLVPIDPRTGPALPPS
ncbi:amidase [Stella humosa]|uniref:Amidase n=1 Tax=Stella humosa TaxID=94 RepID=A0A3N1L8K5_9PROT|nr:amidase family protein [Stella humosa]ROP91023.1 amidase [Stella humosa]BBK34627.1 amidase [Stella humosa]